MDIDVSIEKGKPKIAVVTLRGRAQTVDVSSLRHILDSIEEKKVHKVVFNLREATYFPSSMLGLLVSYTINKNSIEASESVALCAVPQAITIELGLLGITKYFLVFDDLTAALSAFGGGKFERYSSSEGAK